MKECIAILVSVLMLLSLLSGCRKVEEVPEMIMMTTEGTMETEATEVTSAPTETTAETTAETTEETTEATGETAVNDTVFKAGTWMSQCGPTSRYYFFEMGGASGRFVNMKDGSGTSFTYVQTGDQGILYLNANGAGAACKVVVQDGEHITLEWENQPAENMTYVSSLGFERFHFYTHEELARMALADYRMKNDPDDESLEAAAMDNGDGSTTIQIYQNLGDHNSTAAYYWVDRCTGEGQNISSGEYVDLTKGSQDIEIFFQGREAALPKNTAELILSETEYSERIVLRPLVTVTDFRVVSLEFVEGEGTYGFAVTEQLYDAESLNPESALVLALELPEIIPNVGVIYKDRNGEEQFYAVEVSGLDGSVLLIEETLF